MSDHAVPLSLNLDLRRALEEFAAPAYVIGRDGRFQWLNRAAVTLIGERLGLPFESVVAPEHRSLARANFARKLLGDDGTVYDLLVCGQGGDLVRLRICSAPLRRGDAVVGVFGLGMPLDRASPPDEALRPELTPRQLETLRLLGEGLETKQIAERLGVADETARNHIRALLRALGVHSRLEAVVEGRRLGLLWPSE
jgi:DNA-binding CsgD family transcriptional regulator